MVSHHENEKALNKTKSRFVIQCYGQLDLGIEELLPVITDTTEPDKTVIWVKEAMYTHRDPSLLCQHTMRAEHWKCFQFSWNSTALRNIPHPYEGKKRNSNVCVHTGWIKATRTIYWRKPWKLPLAWVIIPERYLSFKQVNTETKTISSLREKLSYMAQETALKYVLSYLVACAALSLFCIKAYFALRQNTHSL